MFFRLSCKIDISDKMTEKNIDDFDVFSCKREKERENRDWPGGNRVRTEVLFMLSPMIYLMMNALFFTLRLSGGTVSFPRPLKAAEEREYLERCAAGDLEARNILVEHNLRLVAHIVKKYYAQTGDQDDLISIGTIGLIKGISTFKADKNVRLATYASRCIENATLS